MLMFYDVLSAAHWRTFLLYVDLQDAVVVISSLEATGYTQSHRA